MINTFCDFVIFSEKLLKQLFADFEILKKNYIKNTTVFTK